MNSKDINRAENSQNSINPHITDRRLIHSLENIQKINTATKVHAFSINPNNWRLFGERIRGSEESFL
jgi:hypothetical protein